jgi:hypothetical protein
MVARVCQKCNDQDNGLVGSVGKPSLLYAF